MEIKLEKIPNTKGHKLIITFADGKEIYTTIKGNVGESTINSYEIAWRYVASRRLDNSIYPSLWRYLFTFTS